MTNPIDFGPGNSHPLGATVIPGGVNFCIYSRSATRVELLLFDQPESPAPSRCIRLDRRHNKTFYYWHVFVPGLRAGQTYAWRAWGFDDPRSGLRFDGEKLLLDPYGRAVVVPESYDREAAKRSGDTCALAMRNLVVDPGAYDWEGDRPLERPFANTVIYEMHVAGFTRHPNSGVEPQRRGTYAGLVEKIPYLVELGVTAVELLPVFVFDRGDAPKGKINYWGYSPVSFFAPHPAYSSRQDPMGALDEFRDMVKALHRAEIEVILDVVFNHTAEGDETGPTFCFKGLENSVYYLLESEDRSRYKNFSGCGNTFNANHPVVRRLILDSLRYWVQEMHVDGFRFDLASILARDESGRPLGNPPVLWDIESDPALAPTKLIAEAWDAAGLYQVGTFVGDRWKEWNGRFRDDVRAFLRGDDATVSRVSNRFLASPDIYGHEEREPEQSINFVTCHDGFTLNDLVSYNEKRNQANGEDNRDGESHNLSWNCGVEGPTRKPAVEALRLRQIKNFHTINLLALGVPMLLMGDEARRTQQGNNNAYCQDNELSWFDWSLVKKNQGLVRFVKRLIRFRLNLDVFRDDHGISLNRLLRRSRIDWHGIRLNEADWSDPSHTLSFTIHGRAEHFHIIFNAWKEALDFELPPAAWHRLVDTSLNSPEDFSEPETAPRVPPVYRAEAHSVVVLVANGR